MDELELWARGLLTTGLGPDLEWHPAPPEEHSWVHDRFWKAILGMMPDEASDEPYWMTEAATQELLDN